MNRLVVFRIAIILLFTGLTARLWDLQMSQGQVLSEEATARRQQEVFERPLRGEIFASDGTTRLAESQPSYTIAVRPSQLPRSDEGSAAPLRPPRRYALDHRHARALADRGATLCRRAVARASKR